jgi:ankyrin repeat protein/beta-lactamase regulating signal transducer with metallopeptidase domain
MTSVISDAIIVLSRSVELSLLAKATLLLLIGLAALSFAARQQASVRHLLLAATFAALLVLPLFVVVVPKAVIEVPIPVAATAAIVIAPPQKAAALPPVSFAQQTVPPAPQSELPSWPAILRALWIAGFVLSLAPVLLDLWRLRRLRRNALPWTAAQSRMPQGVELLLHEDLATPLTCGVLRPAVIFPAAARDWPDSELRCALTHELEHVRRFDWPVHLTSRVIASLYWFHPLAWTAWRRLCLEAERACDDAVLQNEESTAYADQLVSLAERTSGAHAELALGMAHRGDLSLRVTSLLDNTQPRGRASRFVAATALAGAALVAIALAPVNAVGQPTPQASANPKPRPNAQAAPQANPKPASTARTRASALDRALYESSEAGELTAIGALLNSGANVNALVHGDGTPLLGAARKGHLDAVRLLLDRGADPNLGISGDGNPLLTAADGGHLECVQLLLNRGAIPDAGVIGDGNALINASANGHLSIVGLLLDRGATIDFVVPGDENAIIQASENGHLAVVKYLVSRGANMNSRFWVERGDDGRGEWRTPLNRAQKNGHTAIVEYLKSVGARE